MRFEKLWPKFEPYADENFLTEIKTNFHARSWEIYLYNVLQEKNFSLINNFQKGIIPKGEGPDFFLTDDTYIECIAVSKGLESSANSVPEPYIATTPDKIL